MTRDHTESRFTRSNWNDGAIERRTSNRKLSPWLGIFPGAPGSFLLGVHDPIVSRIERSKSLPVAGIKPSLLHERAYTSQTPFTWLL